MLVFSILLIWNSKSDHTEACQPQSSIQGYSRNCLSTCSILLWIWHERTEGKEWHQTDAHKVSNIRLANLDFTGKAKKKKKRGWGEGICWNSMSLDSIWTICSSRLGHILMIKLLILSSILSAAQYFHDLLLADLTHYLFGLYYSKDKRLQLKSLAFLQGVWNSATWVLGGRWESQVQWSTDSGIGLLGCEVSFKAVWSWENYFSLCLSFLTYKMGLIIVPPSLGCLWIKH